MPPPPAIRKPTPPPPIISMPSDSPHPLPISYGKSPSVLSQLFHRDGTVVTKPWNSCDKAMEFPTQDNEDSKDKTTGFSEDDYKKFVQQYLKELLHPFTWMQQQEKKLLFQSHEM